MSSVRKACLFVGEHEDRHRRQVLVLQQAAELALRDGHAAPVCAVDHLLAQQKVVRAWVRAARCSAGGCHMKCGSSERSAMHNWKRRRPGGSRQLSIGRYTVHIFSGLCMESNTMPGYAEMRTMMMQSVCW